MALDSAKVRKKIESVDDLPTLPTVASQIIGMANSPMTNAADVGRMIEQDQALTAKVLKLVNSAFYGFPGQIKSIQHAVVIMGFNKVKNVVVTASVFDMAKGRKSDRLDLARFWQHSLGTAVSAKVATKGLSSPLQPDDAFVGGLVHDIGKLILDQFLPEEYGPVLEAAQKRGCLILEAEKELLGFNHSRVGSWLAEKWQLPSTLQHAISQHHRPTHAREDRDMVAAIHLGDIFARALGVGNGGDNRIPAIQPGVWQQYGLTVSFLDESLEAIVDELKKAEDFFDLING